MGNPLNCWEALGCGLHPGNGDTECPVFTAQDFHGVNQGELGGRFCWAVAGTLCRGEVQGVFAEKAMDCMKCEFYARVVNEQGWDYVVLNPDQLR